MKTVNSYDYLIFFVSDYIAGAIPSPITIPAGQMRVCFNSSSIVDDSNQEPPESFMLRLLDTSPMNPNIIFSPETTTVIILDDDCKLVGAIICNSFVSFGYENNTSVV